ncbi:HD domain-containing protein [Paracrocinitomix mangrovi]|uniref:HD domain-containing protein n=1 Tax=Paracrocinitomix mangrovi TaxID=2862509 RepID=UPI001EDC5905|nr:HD domain-containing protein [Paracrocinitomix mangrovi]UKN01548.1 HD domain-containing protein [Paracrocinitomix mangrovi]
MSLQNATSNKRKIINDPVHGFITIPHDFIYDLIQHPFVQRLRRIKQLGMSHLVYPGANHTRFHHALGAMHLMSKAITVLKKKGVEITDDEKLAVRAAILLHDIGHGPFSHTLEHSLLESSNHEDLSLLFMNRLNEEFNGKLDLAISIFTNQYHKPFLHQLVSGQLDMDRLDYLQRDSFFTGVSEGIVGAERIITMLNVRDGELVVEEKGIYSIENFISARRIMYWQVYMHKTVVSSEYMLINILKRANYLFDNGLDLFASPYLKVFLKNRYTIEDFKTQPELLNQFALIDDNDLISAIKVWQFSEDKVLRLLCERIMSRNLFKTEITKEPADPQRINEIKNELMSSLQITESELEYFIDTEILVNNAYNERTKQIHILSKDGSIQDLAMASDNFNILSLSKPVEKFCLCYYNVK